MIIINDTIISEDFLQARFICDLPRCKGDCCVSGDAGAPLEEDEIGPLEDSLDVVVEYMTEAGKLALEKNGSFDYDDAGKMVTPLVNDRECIYAVFHENGVSFCAIEKAFLDGKIDFRKPVSCHLYPIRLVQKDGFTHINYHQWSICVPAKRKGEKAGLPLYKFLKDALIRRFGDAWYQQLDKEMKKRR